MIQFHKINLFLLFSIQQLVLNFINFNHQKLFTIRLSLMMRRNLQLPFNTASFQQTVKQSSYSPSTQASASPRDHVETCCPKSSIRKDKEKSQLCKKYMEYGFCPYEKKCKFAHGSHELKKNQQPNSKYKTKECGVYLTEGYCMYGQRCNFIHIQAKCGYSSNHCDVVFQEVKAEGRLQSRLLKLLKSN